MLLDFLKELLKAFSFSSSVSRGLSFTLNRLNHWRGRNFMKKPTKSERKPKLMH